MNCPGCQRELPGFSLATLCPYCGAELPKPMFQPIWVSWPKFFAVLVAPAVVCFLAGTIDSLGLVILSGLFGSLISGLVCARMLMNGVTLQGYQRALVHFCLGLAMCGLTWFLCFLGCTAQSR